jgi:hypothetical protein
MHNAVTGMRRPDITERMRANNPMKNPESVEKMRQSLSGRTFLSRGGNGKTTVPQEMIAKRMNLQMEFAISTLGAKGVFPSLPSCYKVDLAIPEMKIAIEVDGKTHLRKNWIFLDARKTSILNHLGWSVLRFTNQEVLRDLDAVVEKINSYTTLK